MPIDVTLANRALQIMGAEDQLPDPDHDSFAARTIRAAWDEVRREVIRGTPDFRPKWNFALTYAELPARTITAQTPLPYGWSAAYPLPQDCLRFVELADETIARCGWKLVAGAEAEELLVKSTGALKIWYLRDMPEAARWDATFRAAFAAMLAFQTADRITGDRARKQDAWAEFEAKMKAATGADASESAPEEPEESDWVLARLGSGLGNWGRPIA